MNRQIDKLEIVREAVRVACREKGLDVDKLCVVDASGKSPPGSFTRAGNMPSGYYGQFSIWRPKSKGESAEGYKVATVIFNKGDNFEAKAWEAGVHVSAYVQEHGYEWDRGWWEDAQ